MPIISWCVVCCAPVTYSAIWLSITSAQPVEYTTVPSITVTVVGRHICIAVDLVSHTPRHPDSMPLAVPLLNLRFTLANELSVYWQRDQLHLLQVFQINWASILWIFQFLAVCLLWDSVSDCIVLACVQKQGVCIHLFTDLVCLPQYP